MILQPKCLGNYNRDSCEKGFAEYLFIRGYFIKHLKQ